MEYRFTAALWQSQGRSVSWWFVTVPPEVSDELAELPLPPRGFGSIKVTATIGATTWSTSVFPSDARRGYILPVKKSVRAAENVADGASVDVVLVPVR
ncbi:DUF1905 domain-containing protein [Xylanimonas ulmi]|uniref:Uncharacterized protein DUF1905 n=1 Tax=Xylanimonas ulmi TaxID=228973 RepID=A0A4Q7M5M4_9MICO|nr:DUF1905 domain-containing protein [Xylanibacterium ulmi]RZS63276.1 uncharacterized protein DUF1905 [Xylanibacterium ulmi]